MSISDSKWLTLSEAAQLLGVHPTTLRRWADQGSVPVSVTPGGHRRFLEADLATNATRRQMLVGVRDNTAQVWGDYALVETRQRLFNRPEPAWLVAFDEQERTEKRELGRRLAEMGVGRGVLVEVESVAPMGDPIRIRVRGYQLALRRSEAQGIIVIER